MSLFYFHLWTGDGLERDDTGLECQDVEEAYIQAFHAAQGIWIEQVQMRADPRRYRFEVTDCADNVLFDLPFVEVINRPPRAPAPLLPIVRSNERNTALVSEVARQVSRVVDNVQTSRKLIAQLDSISRNGKS